MFWSTRTNSILYDELWRLNWKKEFSASEWWPRTKQTELSALTLNFDTNVSTSIISLKIPSWTSANNVKTLDNFFTLRLVWNTSKIKKRKTTGLNNCQNYIIFLADPGEAMGCSTNTSVIQWWFVKMSLRRRLALNRGFRISSQLLSSFNDVRFFPAVIDPKPNLNCENEIFLEKKPYFGS